MKSWTFAGWNSALLDLDLSQYPLLIINVRNLRVIRPPQTELGELGEAPPLVAVQVDHFLYNL